jgi:hypothetical protein
MLVHYCDHNDNEQVAEITPEAYREIIKTYEGHKLATAMHAAIKIKTKDPRVSELDDTHIFFSYNDAANQVNSVADMVLELDEAMA